MIPSVSALTKYPTVTAHGMGDSCFNSGMKQITAQIASDTDQYAVCIPTGKNLIQDTERGFFMTMNDNVDVFAEKVKNDSKLAQGFNCVSFSQGAMLCRGYIQKYNGVNGFPPVISWLAVHSTASGVAGFPHCNPAGLLGPVCKIVANIGGDVAYTKASQDLLFQIDYYRDPNFVNKTSYKTTSQLAQWNNEGETVDPSIKANFIKVKKYAMIKAMKDSMVFPNEGEWWGHFEDGSLSKVLTMKETRWYTEDLFGLKTVDEAGKIVFNTTAGDHLQFTIEQLSWWVLNYFED